MRIFLSCLQSPQDYPLPAYRFWREYFYKGLREAGHEVIEAEVDWARGLLLQGEVELRRWKETTWTATVERVRSAHRAGGIDLFLSYLYPRQILAEALWTLQKMGIPCVNFYCDHVREYRSVPDEFAPFDLHWVPEAKALPWYRARGWKYLHAPMPCWIDPSLRRLPTQESPAVSFIGGRDPLRAALLADVVRAGLPLEIRGPGWRDEAPVTRPSATLLSRTADWQNFISRQGFRAAGRRLVQRFTSSPPEFDFSGCVRPMPSMTDYQSLVRQSRVSLGINRYPDFRHSPAHPGTYSRLRDIEAPMLGACYLTEWTEGLDELYDLDTEITTYRTAEELIAQAEKLLADAPHRQRLRAAGQRRALRDHTVGRSVARLAAHLGIPAR